MSRSSIHHLSSIINPENAFDGFGATMMAGPIARHDSAERGRRMRRTNPIDRCCRPRGEGQMRQTNPILVEEASALIITTARDSPIRGGKPRSWTRIAGHRLSNRLTRAVELWIEDY